MSPQPEPTIYNDEDDFDHSDELREQQDRDHEAWMEREIDRQLYGED